MAIFKKKTELSTTLPEVSGLEPGETLLPKVEKVLKTYKTIGLLKSENGWQVRLLTQDAENNGTLDVETFECISRAEAMERLRIVLVQKVMNVES